MPDEVSQSGLKISSLPKSRAILAEAWLFYKERFLTLLEIIAIPVLFSALSSLIGKNNFFSGFIFLILYLIAIAWGSLALIYAIKNREEKIGFVEAYRYSFKKILSFWWLSLLGGFITLSGFVLLIVPGIIFTVWFSLAIFILVAEDLKGMNALLKSREYVKGKWKDVFWRLFFISLLTIVIFLPSLILGFLGFFSKIPHYNGFIIYFISASITYLTYLLWIPLMVTYEFLIYRHLKTIKSDLVFVPSKKTKAIFWVIGFLAIPLFILTLVFIFKLAFKSASLKANDAYRQQNLRQIQASLTSFYNEKKKYPLSLDELVPTFLSSSTIIDPFTHKVYQYQSNGYAYQLCTFLESRKTIMCLNAP